MGRDSARRHITGVLASVLLVVPLLAAVPQAALAQSPEIFQYTRDRSGPDGAFRLEVLGVSDIDSFYTLAREQTAEGFHTERLILHAEDEDYDILADARPLLPGSFADGPVNVRDAAMSDDGRAVVFTVVADSGEQFLFLFRLGCTFGCDVDLQPSILPLNERAGCFDMEQRDIDADATMIAFASTCTGFGVEGGQTIVPGRNIFLYDVEEDVFRLLNPHGEFPSESSPDRVGHVSLSADGSTAVFTGGSSLINPDLFTVPQLATQVFYVRTDEPSPLPITQTARRIDDKIELASGERPEVNRDGTVVTFVSGADDLAGAESPSEDGYPAPFLAFRWNGSIAGVGTSQLLGSDSHTVEQVVTDRDASATFITTSDDFPSEGADPNGSGLDVIQVGPGGRAEPVGLRPDQSQQTGSEDNGPILGVLGGRALFASRSPELTPFLAPDVPRPELYLGAGGEVAEQISGLRQDIQVAVDVGAVSAAVSADEQLIAFSHDGNWFVDGDTATDPLTLDVFLTIPIASPLEPPTDPHPKIPAEDAGVDSVIDDLRGIFVPAFAQGPPEDVGPAPVQADHFLLGTEATFADALASGTGQGQGLPLLLTPADALDPQVAAAFTEFGTTRVTILGGPAAIAPAVEAELVGMGITVDRAAGPSRIHTAVAIAEAFNSDATIAYVMRAFGEGSAGFADALGGSSAVARTRGVALLTETGQLSQPTREWLASSQVESIVVVGGTAAVSAATEAELQALNTGAGTPLVTRLAGESREGTAAALAMAHPCDLFDCTPDNCQSLPGCDPATSCTDTDCDFSACPLGVRCDESSAVAPLVDPLVVDGFADSAWISAFLYAWTGRPILLFNPQVPDGRALAPVAMSPPAPRQQEGFAGGSGEVAGTPGKAFATVFVEGVAVHLRIYEGFACIRVTRTDPVVPDMLTVNGLEQRVGFFQLPGSDHMISLHCFEVTAPDQPLSIQLGDTQLQFTQVVRREGASTRSLDIGVYYTQGVVYFDAYGSADSVVLTGPDGSQVEADRITGGFTADATDLGEVISVTIDGHTVPVKPGILPDDVEGLAPRILSSTAPNPVGDAACVRDQ